MAKKLHFVWHKLRPINAWYFLAVALISGVICVGALRNNNFTMIELRNNVFQADKDNGDVETALRNLRAYIYAHMNTNLSSGNNNVKPPIQLKYRYQRLVTAEQSRVDAANAQVYTDAQHVCEAEFPNSFSGGPRVPCITAYVSSHGISAQPIPDSLYKFDFVSPTWTPDLAGWTMVVSFLFFMLFVFRYGLERWVQHELKRNL